MRKMQGRRMRKQHGGCAKLSCMSTVSAAWRQGPHAHAHRALPWPRGLAERSPRRHGSSTSSSDLVTVASWEKSGCAIKARPAVPSQLERGNDGLGGFAEHRVGHRRRHHRRRGKLRDGRGRLVSIFLELRSSSSFSPAPKWCVRRPPEVDTGCTGFLIRISEWQSCLEPCEWLFPSTFFCFSLGTNGQPNVPQPHQYSYLFLAGFCIFSLSRG